jgi:hypothetical protein
LYFFKKTTLACLSEKEDTVVLLVCSQRARTLEQMIDIDAECAPFMESLVFKP